MAILRSITGKSYHPKLAKLVWRILLLIIILQKISIVHNLRVKASSHCTYSKIQYKYIYKNKQTNKKEEQQTEHTRISQLLHHEQSYNLQRKKKCKKPAG